MFYPIAITALLFAAAGCMWWQYVIAVRAQREAAEWRAEAQRLAALNRALAFERLRDLQSLLAALEVLPQPDKAGRALEVPAPESLQ